MTARIRRGLLKRCFKTIPSKPRTTGTPRSTKEGSVSRELINERHLKIVKLRDEEKLTYKAIGEKIGLTKSRIRDLYLTAKARISGLPKKDE